jgi:hypothetical protein
MVQFMTGFLVGSNLTGSDETLHHCQNTLSNEIVYNGVIFGENIVSTDPPTIFTALYSLYDMMFYSNDLVDKCTLLGYAVKDTANATFVGIKKPSRVLNNLSNNFDNAYSSYNDVKMFMSEP